MYYLDTSGTGNATSFLQLCTYPFPLREGQIFPWQFYFATSSQYPPPPKKKTRIDYKRHGKISYSSLLISALGSTDKKIILRV